MGKIDFLQRLKSQNHFGIFAQSYALELGSEYVKEWSPNEILPAVGLSLVVLKETCSNSDNISLP